MTLFFIIDSLFFPLLYLVLGIFLWKHTPKKMHGGLGWRTRRAQQSWETWEFANSYAGKNLFVLGIILSVVSIVLAIVFSLLHLEWFDQIVVMSITMLVMPLIQVGLFGVIIYRVEHKLKERFGDR